LIFMTGNGGEPVAIAPLQTTLAPTATVNSVPLSNSTATSPLSVTAISLAISTPQLSTYDPAALQQQMLTLINQDRLANGLRLVAWDEVAAEAGRLHAEEMVKANYFSHWNQVGLGPDHRYALAGGLHAVRENLHAYANTYGDGQGAPVESWPAIIERAQEGLMDSPGHRDNILDPAHTHVGIGMAYDSSTGQFRLAQEFTNQYVQLKQPLPAEANLGDKVLISGHLAGDGLSDALLNLAYEPFPNPMSLEALAQTHTYYSGANSVNTWAIDLTFQQTIALTGNEPGLYHIRIFVDITNTQALVLNHIIFYDG
jgi:uncharacterized protein YkwD